MKCQICNSEETIRSMAMHLGWNHQMKTEQYIKKFGEFRPKELEKLLKKQKSGLRCEICNQKMMHNRQLMHHIPKFHPEITQEEYIVKYYLDNKWPTCKCGCGERVEILISGNNSDLDKQTYHRDYIKGHWDWVQVGYFNHTDEMKLHLRETRINTMSNDPNFFKKISDSEKEFVSWLEQYIKLETSNRKLLHGKELDIFIPEFNIAIEFNGTYYHCDKFKDKNYHLKKTRECENIGIRLIHVWEHDWHFKKDIIKSIILNIIGKIENKIYARKCIIKEIPHEVCVEFLNKNHLQGNINSKIRLGLYYNNEIISVMTLGAKRFENKEGYELLRFCNKLNTIVVGGASKLFKYFINNYNPENIISYANRDWSQGKVYEKLGFKFISNTLPGYAYYKGLQKFSRQNYTKQKLVNQGFDSNLTEFEIMNNRNYFRIWDCGNIKLEWNKIL